ncbi:DUF1016 N-terminal domain-containing protein [Sphingobacterium sp. FBM7-1]|uniref:DUF1016 N-terminal domain-containing protein n=1 Tax=Sphingobacterium sp. FBM7-1 TaxID=2886688 RepID=UPI001D126982|nr:DUF1016 N-terminal domain-containing protein [Sphingobacterium sp. FBM7-1]MCC2598518.1 DUF1016 N-terminal domain-containing protein [Sphingobacterium sp. FBM7-1]
MFNLQQLQPEVGSCFSTRQIDLYKQFYYTFENVHALYAQLSWIQYKLLLSTNSQDKREFDIAETSMFFPLAFLYFCMSSINQK